MKHPSEYAHAEIRIQVVVICGPTRYQLYHGGIDVDIWMTNAMLKIKQVDYKHISKGKDTPF